MLNSSLVMYLSSFCWFHFINFVLKTLLHVVIMFSTLQKHKLPISYDFHKYMVRSMEDEFHGILGIRYVLIWMNFNSSTNFLWSKKLLALCSHFPFWITYLQCPYSLQIIFQSDMVQPCLLKCQVENKKQFLSLKKTHTG
jgi:hypothetical protein